MYRCPLCGQLLEFISDYHCSLHRMTKEDYIKKYSPKKLTFRDINIRESRKKILGITEADTYQREISEKLRKK